MKKSFSLCLCGVIMAGCMCCATACSTEKPVAYINGFYRNEKGELILTKTDNTEINAGLPYGAVTGENASTGLAYTLSEDGTYYVLRGIGACTDTNIVVPETYAGLPVKEIGVYAFCGQNAVTSITISKTVGKIGECAFDSTLLQAIHIVEENEMYASLDGVLYTKDMQTLLVYPTNKKDKSFHVPDSVTKIETFAFQNNLHMTDLFLPVDIEPHDPVYWVQAEIKNIFYKGNAKQWEQHTYNPFDATVYWYSEEKPTERGKYWHDKDGILYVFEVNTSNSGGENKNPENDWTKFY